MIEEIEQLRVSADGGDAEAQFKLAQILNHGLGTAMDEDGALALYRTSAAQGYERAQFTLGEICKEGRITPQDLVQAYMWFVIVADTGSGLVAAAHEACEVIEPFMTPEQISEGRARAADWSVSS